MFLAALALNLAFAERWVLPIVAAVMAPALLAQAASGADGIGTGLAMVLGGLGLVALPMWVRRRVPRRLAITWHGNT